MELDLVQAQEYEALLGFLYLAPIGIVRASSCGVITLVNPVSARLLMQLAPDRTVANLFDALSGVLPDLRERVSTFPGARGLVLQADRVPAVLPDDQAPTGTARGYLSLTVLKIKDDTLIAVLQDISTLVRDVALQPA